MEQSDLKYKIYVTFLAIGVFFIAFSLLMLNRVYTINLQSTEIEKDWLPGIILVNAINTATNDYHITQTLYFLSDNEIDAETLHKEMQRISNDITDWRAAYETLISSEEERQLYQYFSEGYANYLKESQTVFNISSFNDNLQKVKKIENLEELLDGFNQHLVKLVELQRQGALESSRKGDTLFERSRSIILFSGIFVIIFMTILMFLLESWRQASATSFYKMKIRFIFIITTFIFIVYGWLQLERMEQINQQSTEIVVNWLPSIIAVNTINTAASQYRIAEISHVLIESNSDKEKSEQKLRQIAQNIRHWRSKYEALISSAEERDIYQSFSQSYTEYSTVSEQIIMLSRQNKNREALIKLKQNSLLFTTLGYELNKLVKLNKVSAFQASRTGDDLYELSKIFVIGGSVFVLMTLVILALLLESWISVQPTISTVAIPPKRKKRKVNFLKSLTIKTKLRFAFLSILGLFVLSMIAFEIFMKHINDKSTEIEVNWMPSIITINAINTATSDYRIAEVLHITSTDDIQMSRWEEEMKRIAELLTELRTHYETLISSEKERQIYQTFSAQYEKYSSASKQAIALSRKNENEQAATQLKINGTLFNTFSHNLNKLVTLNQEGGLNASHSGDQLFKQSKQISIFIGLFVVTLIIIFLILFEQGISIPLQQLTTIIQHLAQGNTSVNNHLQDRDDEIGQISDSVNEVIQTLKSLTSDSLELIEAAKSGILSVRVEAERHPGEFSQVIVGMNQLLEILGKPLNEIAYVMQNFALGELSGRMQGDYEGELRALKININHSLDAIVNLLSELTTTTERMAKGDLTHLLTGNYQGEFSALKANVNQSIIQMTEMLKIISADIENSAAATTQTSSAAIHVSSQAAKQMSALEETAVAVEQTAASVQEVASNAEQGNELAQKSTKLAEMGNEQLHKLIALIQQIGNQYSRIEQVTVEITRIADKTHLLSLNAGLEAMRAGEHGLGFGFVAQQIGKLAEEVTESARDIGTVINSSAEKVRSGVQTAEETQQAMTQITEAAKSSGSMVQNISTAIGQQSIVVQSLAERISEIQSSSESTAAAAEEISQTITQIAEIAQKTSIQIQRFSLN